MDSNEAPPPPYSVDDPFVASANNNSSDNASTAISAAPLRLRGGDAPLHDIVLRDGSASSVNESSAVSLDLPANFESAAAYFVERPPTVFEGGRPILSHHLTIYPRSQSKDFPRRPRCWNSRTEEITQQDWDMFLRYLFPPHLGLAGSSAHLPRQVRAEIQRDRKDRPQETDEQRQSRIAAVIAEWNECFFEPRATQVAFIYVTDLETAPPSSLCPKCYPAATRSVQSSEAGRSPVPVHPDMPSPASGQQTASPASSGHAPGMYPYQNPHIPPGPYAPYGSYPFHPAGAPNTPPPNAYLPPHFQQPLPWGWNNQPFNPHHQSSSTPKGGPLGWIASLASQAQKYGERISEQAQQYGDQISAQAQRYGRQVEEQAMAHGRWIEEQADFQGQRVKETFTGFGPRPRGEWNSTDPRAHAYYTHTHHYAHASPNNTSQQMDAPPPQRARRSSASSVSSGSSLTSIDSISTTSDLSSSDLATIRAQLLSLEDHHDRELYEAAVGLRRELDVLQASRRQMRVSGRGHWGDVWGHNRGYRRGDRGGWDDRRSPGWVGRQSPGLGGVRGNGIGPGRGAGRGRWESPQQHERSSAERRAVKEEMRATKKAFKDVLRRAREEQRERIRAKRNRRRQEKRSRNSQREGVPTPELPLEQHLENLELGNNRENSAVQSSVPGPSTTRSVSSEASLVSTPSTVLSEVNEGKSQSKEARKQAKELQKQAEKKRKESEKLLRKNKDTAPPGDR